jgi:hypothetical protein
MSNTRSDQITQIINTFMGEVYTKSTFADYDAMEDLLRSALSDYGDILLKVVDDDAKRDFARCGMGDRIYFEKKVK